MGVHAQKFLLFPRPSFSLIIKALAIDRSNYLFIFREKTVYH